jgi:putative ABC transport system permease protein
MLLQKAWGDVRARKLRTGLVVFSVAVAVFGVSSITILGDGFTRSATEKYVDSNPPDLVVNTLPLAPAPRDALRALDNVRAVESRVTGTARWQPPGGDRDEPLAIQGVADLHDARALDRVRLVQGAFPGADEVLFEKGARQKYGLTVGQQVTLRGAGGERTYTVAGFGENPNVATAAVVGFASAWLTRDAAASLLQVDGDTQVLVQMRDAATAALRDSTQQRVRESLEGDEVTVLTSQVQDPAAVPGHDLLAALHTILLAFGLLGACASALLVVNTISTIVLEQRPQIGAMKAVGATTRDVLAMYLLLALLYGALGTGLGLLAGVGFAAFAEGARAAALDEPAGALALSPAALGLAAVIGLGSCLLGALAPSWVGARVTVREALISYGLSARFGRGVWDRLVMRLPGLPPAVMLAARNVFRQPYRALFTLLGLAAATAALLAVLATLNALSISLHAAGQALRADLMLSFDTAAEGAAVDAALADAAGLDRRELWLVSSAKLGDKTITVTGLPPDTDVFDTHTVRPGGQWLRPGATDQAVVTQRLAARHALQVGSAIELASGSRPARRWTVVGIVAGAGADAFAPEGSVYAPIESVRALADFPEGRGNQLYVRLTDRGPTQLEVQAPALAATLADAGLSNMPVKLAEQQENAQRIFAGFVLLFTLVILIMALVGALGLFGTLAMNVAERRREIGVLRSIGAPTHTVLATFLGEGLLLGLCGWGAGTLLGVPASRLLVGFFSDTLIPLEYGFPVAGVLVAALAIAALALLASVGPALLATRIRIAAILRYA